MSKIGTELMTVTEVAEAYSFSKTTVYEAIRAGDLAAFKPPLKNKNGNGQWRIKKTAADAWVDNMIEQFERNERGRLRAA